MLQKGLHPDPQSKAYVGYPTICNGDQEALATDCLGCLLKGLQGNWECLCAYYLTTHLSGQQQAEIVLEILKFAHEHGIRIRGLVFDGTASNLKCAEALGADLTPGKQQTFFLHPVTKEKVYIFIDPPHLMKLARNHLEDAGKFLIPGFKQPAEWAHISALQEYQEEIGFRALRKKLTKRHIQFYRNKMKVSLATQTFSSSVADSLLLVKDRPELLGCEATSELCRRLDSGFDLLNSRSRFAKGDKSPITRENFAEKKEKLMTFYNWLRGLKLTSGQSLQKSRKGTFVIGLCASILSTIALAEKMLFREVERFLYFLVHNTHQDFLEHYFGRLRRKGGLKERSSS